MMPSLLDACLYFIANHIAAFSAATLAPIPSQLRLRLLPFAPAIDLWRLDRSPEFCRGLELVLKEEWRRRVGTHITVWKAPKGLEFVSDREEATFRETYLRYTLQLLLTSTGEELMQRPSPFHVRVGHRKHANGGSVAHDAYEHHLKFIFHLHRDNPRRVPQTKLLSKYTYINFLFYGIHIDSAPGWLRNFETYVFDSEKKYLYPRRSDVQPNITTWPQISPDDPRLWFQTMLSLLKGSSGWMPEKLDIVTPSREFFETVSSGSVSEYLSSAEEINVRFFNDVGFIEVAVILMKLFKMNKLSPASISIKTRYKYQVVWLLPRLAAVCGRLLPCDKLLFPHFDDQQQADRISSFRNITISTQSDGSLMSPSDWGVIMFQDRIESITLRACIPTNFPFLLSHLLTTRSSLRLIDLAECWKDYNSLQLLVSTFLFAFTDHPQTLIIRELPPLTGIKTQQEQVFKLPLEVSGPCRSGEHKTLCVPYISSGPCSLTWLLSLPELNMKTLELTVMEEDYKSHLNEIHQTLKLAHFPFKCTIFVCCDSHFPSPAELSKSQVISELRMCPLVKDVRFVIESYCSI